MILDLVELQYSAFNGNGLGRQEMQLQMDVVEID